MRIFRIPLKTTFGLYVSEFESTMLLVEIKSFKQSIRPPAKKSIFIIRMDIILQQVLFGNTVAKNKVIVAYFRFIF